MYIANCAICDEMSSKSVMKWEEITKKYKEKCINKLSTSSDLPDDLMNYYSLSIKLEGF